jgi:hypothetical protein
MTNQDLIIKFCVQHSPAEVFSAINNVRAWWAEGIEGNSEKLQDEFLFVHKDIHRSMQKVVEMVTNKRVVWLITDAYLTFVPNKTEWIGTKIIFEIVKRENDTELIFTHQGLVPTFECYGNCSNAWTFLITDSLKNFIQIGEGKPISNNLK